MATIRPSSDLRNKYNEISEFCHTHQEPVYITKNGAGDLVVLANETYEAMFARQELHRLLDEGLADVEAGRVIPVEKAFAELSRRFGWKWGEE